MFSPQYLYFRELKGGEKMPEFIEVGKIVNTHGLKGELKVTPWCDDISVFEAVGKVYAGDTSYSILSAKEHKHSYLIRLSGIESVEAAEKLKNKILLADKADMPELPENTYYIRDLIGLSVYSGETLLGELVDCFPTGSNDVYAVRQPDGRQLLLPAIWQVVKKIDLAAGRMDVELMEGLTEHEI